MKLFESIIQASGTTHSATVIFFHGSGSTGNNLIEWIRFLMGRNFDIPYVKFIFPTAPMQKHTPLKGKYSRVWFDCNKISIYDSERIESLSSIYETVDALLNREIEGCGIPANRVIIGEFMNTFLDMNSHTQFWTSSQVSTISTLNAQIVINQATSHNTSNAPSSITFTDELKQQITGYILENDPNISSNDIMDIISILETMSTISLKYLTLDQLTQLTSYVVSSFTNNTITNGFISTTSASTSTTTSSSSSTSSTTTAITASTLSPAINQQVSSTLSQLAPNLSPTQIQNLLTAIETLYQTFYFTPLESIIVSPGLGTFYLTHSGPYVVVSGTTAAYTDADKLSITSFFNVWVPRMTASEIQLYIINMQKVSYYSQSITALEALALAPAIAQIFTNQANSQTTTVKA
ncbi:unnamed protein product [Chironomus riparius]|uniref:palmitoyl-protein hydrolase n=1 Tax=Chironomus riparius TaxID=315576 RepID=A0A9N9RKI7_9DIPT|nr:unnamed protein product [Chironomus riparius]